MNEVLKFIWYPFKGLLLMTGALLFLLYVITSFPFMSILIIGDNPDQIWLWFLFAPGWFFWFVGLIGTLYDMGKNP